MSDTQPLASPLGVAPQLSENTVSVTLLSSCLHHALRGFCSDLDVCHKYISFIRSC